MRSPTVLQQISDQCVHFNGIQHGACKAGVTYKDVRAPAGSFGYPCVKSMSRGSTCARAEYPTAEQAAAEDARIQAALDAHFGRIAAGKCGHCGEDVNRYSQVGNCAYAEPCGHRMGQADAAAMNKALAAHREAATNDNERTATK